MSDTVRIGIIGAGAFTTGRVLPNFQQLPGVEVTAVANRTRASAEKVAEQFGIPLVASDYRELIASPNVDAVFIGAPPYLHREAALAAFDAGKHVLCQTRLTVTAEDARVMHQRAEEARAQGVRSMLVPPAPYQRGSKYVAHLIESGFLGKLRHVQSFNMNASLADAKTPLRGGRDWPTYGRFNALQVGLSYDVLSRWTGHATSVVAQQATFTPERAATPDGPMMKSPYPDEVTAVAETTSGAIMMNLLNYAAYFSESRVELYGEEGTVVYRSQGDVIVGARADEKELRPLPIPAEYDSPWRVEEEFVRLVRGEIDQASFTFFEGVKNLEYMEAVHVSASEGRRVALP